MLGDLRFFINKPNLLMLYTKSKEDIDSGRKELDLEVLILKFGMINIIFRELMLIIP